MSVRSLNKVQLIGNLTRDPELRFTPQGTAVCSFGLATNRSWTTDSGDKREETEFHRIVAWAKLAELCSQLLFKGRRIYVEGRLQTRQWTAQDGSPRSTTEVVIDDMIILDSKHEEPGARGGQNYQSNQSNQSNYNDYTQGPPTQARTQPTATYQSPKPSPAPAVSNQPMTSSPTPTDTPSPTDKTAEESPKAEEKAADSKAEDKKDEEVKSDIPF